MGEATFLHNYDLAIVRSEAEQSVARFDFKTLELVRLVMKESLRTENIDLFMTCDALMQEKFLTPDTELRNFN